MIRQRFTDYEQWRTAFDSLAHQRASLGLRTVAVTQALNDAAQAVVLFQFEDITRVRQHFPSPELAEAHERAGVVRGSTETTFLTEAPPPG